MFQGSYNHGYGHELVNKQVLYCAAYRRHGTCGINIAHRASSPSARAARLRRIRTYVQISSSGVTSVVTATAGTRPLATGTHAEDGTAKEETAERISRQVLHRRLHRLGRKLDDVTRMVMFRAVADAARIERKGGRGRQKPGARTLTGANPRRRRRGKPSRFMAAPRGDEVKDSHHGKLTGA